MASVEQREDKQPLIKPSAVVGAGLAATLAAFFTSRFGVAGTVLGTALTAMIITAGSAFFSVYLERAAARTRDITSVVRVRTPRRSVLLGALLAAVASFVVGMGAVTGVELSVGKSLSCWVWNECSTKDDGGGAASGGTTRTRPSILGGSPETAVPTPQPDGGDQPQQTASPRETPQSPAAPAQDGGPHQAPSGRQPAQERPGGTPPDEHAPKERTSAASRDSEQPVPPDDPSADRPPSEHPVQPSPWVGQQRPT
jgi:hypothetical protein